MTCFFGWSASFCSTGVMLWICTARTDLLYTNHSHPYLKGPILFGHTLSCSDTSILVGVDARKWNTLYLTERVSQNVTELLVDRIMLAGRGRGFCFFVSFGQLWPLSWPEVMTGPKWPNSTSHLAPLLHPRKCGRKPEEGCLFATWWNPEEILCDPVCSGSKESDPSGGFV